MTSTPHSIAVLTSGGDSGGMNPAVRAVVRSALHHGIDAYAVHEGYQGLVEGGAVIRRLTSPDVGGILQRGGTVLGTARSAEFRTRDGRRQAARNLVDRGIDALVVVGGDGSLTGGGLFREEWPGLLAELVDLGDLHPDRAAAHPHLRLVGLAGSIDNDMFGTDLTIGTDTALHRIVDALSNPHTGDKPVDEAIDQFYTADVWMHSWDLARALGREPDLGQERCSAALAAIEPMEQLLRDSREFGPAMPVAHNASPQDKLIAFIGRDPAWQPDGGSSPAAG
jgi:hypothetical protein